MDNNKKSALWKNLLTTFVSFLVMLLIAEGLLRIFGYQPWKSTLVSDIEVLHTPDEKLGWKPKPGEYILPAYDPAGEAFKITVSEDGQRVTQPTTDRPQSDEILFIGGSFTFGWAVSDDETFAWKLHQKHPDISFKNLGVNAYGTYQSMLRLESTLKNNQKPVAVIYGFIDHHSARNIAKPSWINHLSQANGNHLANVPYVTLDAQKKLIRHPSSSYLYFPFREYSALVNLSQNVINRGLASDRINQQEEVLIELVKQMQALCHENGIDFYVVALSETRKVGNTLENFLEQQGISYFDCSVENTAKYLVPGDGHPNGKAHDLIAGCISSNIVRHYIKKGESQVPEIQTK